MVNEIEESKSEDSRLVEATHWVQNQLMKLAVEIEREVELVPLSGDASFRRYFRLSLPKPLTISADSNEQGSSVRPQSSLILMDAPPAKEDSEPFVAVGKLMKRFGICVPRILALDLELGFLLLEDFGDELLLPLLDDKSVDGWYRTAMEDLLALQTVAASELPAYDREKLLAEMQLFPEWFLGTYLQLSLSEQEQTLIEEVFSSLLDSALEQPQVFVHRDYHSRNLMVLGDSSEQKLGMIDFQDAVSGPVTYDLVSLLKDCYIQWPKERVLYWLDEYLNLKNIDSTERDKWIQWLDLMGMQRHIKVLGIFARLGIRDHKPQFFADLPMVFSYVFKAVDDYPQFADFKQWLSATVLPAFLEKQPEAKARLESWL